MQRFNLSWLAEKAVGEALLARRSHCEICSSQMLHVCMQGVVLKQLSWVSALQLIISSHLLILVYE